jgi:hypothetical protein
MAKNPFDGDKLLAAFSECKKYTGDVPMEPFCQGMEQLRRIVLTLGSAFAIASNDITEKLETLAKRQADLKNAGRPMQPAVLGDDGLPYDTTNARNTVQCMS